MTGLLYFLIFIPFCWSKVPLPAVSYLLVTRVGPCQERKPSELVVVSEMSLHKEKYESSLSGEVYILEDIKKGWTVKATMQKCHDIRNLDTCDFYKSVPIIKNGCLHSDEADVHNMFYQYVTPKMGCPVQAGNYTINHFPFFTEDNDLTGAKSKLSTSVFGYTYRLEGYNKKYERLLCVESHLRRNYIRNHDWTGDRKYGDTSATDSGDEDNERREANDGKERNRDNEDDDA